MSRTFVAAAVSGLLTQAFMTCLVTGGDMGLGVASVRAQSQADIALSAYAEGSGSLRCFEVQALRERIAYYGRARLGRASELRLELHVDGADSAELRVYRMSEFVSRRRFEKLPDACEERRDAVALSIALALEAVIHALPPAVPPYDSARETTALPDSPALPAPGAPPSAASGPGGSERGNDRPSQTEPTPAERETGPKSGRTDAERAEREAEVDSRRAHAEEAEPDRAQDEPNDAEAYAQTEAEWRQAPSVHLHAGGRLLANAAPMAVWTGSLGAELWLNRHIAIDMSALASTLGNSSLDKGRAKTWLAGGELLGCGALGFQAFAAQGCLGAIMAACQASGAGYDIPFPASTLMWIAGTARAALRWPQESRVSVRLVVQGHVNLRRPELQVASSSARLYPPWLGGSAGLDMIVSLE